MKKLITFAFLINLIFLINEAQAKFIIHPRVINVKADVKSQATKPIYYSRPISEVRKLCAKKSPNAIGCTHYQLHHKYNFHTTKLQNQYLIVDMLIYYNENDLYVYIDDTYPTNSLTYLAIKKHEDFHVAIDLDINTEEIKSELEKCISDKIGIDSNQSNFSEYVKECVDTTWNEMIKNMEDRNDAIDADETKKSSYLEKQMENL